MGEQPLQSHLRSYHSWVVLSPDGAIKRSQWSTWDSDNQISVQYYENRNPTNDAVLFHEERTYQKYGGQLTLTQLVRGTGSATQTTTYQYDASNRKSLEQDSSGTWTHYDYWTTGTDLRPSAITSGYLDYTYNDYLSDNSRCRKTQYSYDTEDYANDDGTARPHVARKETQYILGAAVSQIKRVLHKDPATGVVDWIKEYRMATVDGTLGDANNLVTTNNYYTTGSFAGRLKTVSPPDGTRQAYFYSTNSTQMTTTALVGQPDPANATNVLNGTKSITVFGTVGQSISNIVIDISSGITLASQTYTNYDEYYRPGRVTYLDGTYEETQYQYSCCGSDTTTDRDGAVTQYWYDALGRQTATTRLNITTTNVLDAAGHVLLGKRIGSDLSVITNSQAGYDLAGRLSQETNALLGVTAYAESTNASGQLVRTATYPDGGTRIETYYKDGTLYEVGGSAAQPMRYLYGVDTSGPDAGRPFSYEIRLTAAGTTTGTNEWTKTYTDVFGRAFKTVYAKSTTPYPTNQSFYNKKGQLSKSVDPDGIATLYQYNVKGEAEYTATDLNTTDTAVDGNGN